MNEICWGEGAQPALVVVEDWDEKVRQLASRDLALAIMIHWLREERGNLRPGLNNLVEDRDGAGKGALTTNLGATKTEQPNNISRVSVEGLGSIRGVDSGQRILWVKAEISNMAKKMSFAILRDGLAKVQSDGPVGCRRLANTVPGDRDALEEVEPLAIHHFFLDLGEGGRQTSHEMLDVFLDNACQVFVTVKDVGDSTVKLGDIARCQRVCPGLRTVSFVLSKP
jgi:hypothetical protein